MSKTLEFYFDYLSPYAYLGWEEAKRFTQENHLELSPKPVVFGKLLDHYGHLGPAEIPPKRLHVFKDCFRYARLKGISIAMPKSHPFKSLLALRLSLPEVSSSAQLRLIDSLWSMIWGRGGDGSSEEAIREVLAKTQLDADSLLEKAKSKEIKDLLKERTGEAIKRGVFGIPTMFIGEEMFWGKDQFPFMKNYLEGRDPIQSIDLESILNRPRGIDRKAIGLNLK